MRSAEFGMRSGEWKKIESYAEIKGKNDEIRRKGRNEK
jgi:hypothetical protein